MIRYLLYLLGVVLTFTACTPSGDGTADKKETDDTIASVNQPVALEEKFAADLCECLGPDNRQILRELTVMLEQDNMESLEQNEAFNTKFNTLNMALFTCMANLGEQYKDWEGEESEEKLDQAMKNFCGDLYTYLKTVNAPEDSMP